MPQKNQQFLTSAVFIHCHAGTPESGELNYTDLFYTYKGRHFVTRLPGWIDDAKFEEETQVFLKVADEIKHSIELLPPMPWPRDINTLAEHHRSNHIYRNQMAKLRKKITRIRTAAIGVLTRSDHAPAQPDTVLAAQINELTQEN